MPRPGDAVEVDQRQPVATDDLDVLAGDRVAPPLLLDPPPVAHLDRLSTTGPADGDDAAEGIELHVDGRVLAQQSGHGIVSATRTVGGRGVPPDSAMSGPRTVAPATGTQRQRVSGSGASGSVSSMR